MSGLGLDSDAHGTVRSVSGTVRSVSDLCPTDVRLCVRSCPKTMSGQCPECPAMSDKLSGMSDHGSGVETEARRGASRRVEARRGASRRIEASRLHPLRNSTSSHPRMASRHRALASRRRGSRRALTSRRRGRSSVTYASYDQGRFALQLYAAIFEYTIFSRIILERQRCLEPGTEVRNSSRAEPHSPTAHTFTSLMMSISRWSQTW